MPPSISSSDALVIWMLRIAMNAPIMPASTAIHWVALALASAAAAGGPNVPAWVTADMALSWRFSGATTWRRSAGRRRAGGGRARGGLGVDGRIDRHAGPEHHGKRVVVVVEQDLDG